MTDIVVRLLAFAKDQGGWHNIDDTCEEAAAEISSLRARLEEAEKVMIPLVRRCDEWKLNTDKARVSIPLGHLRAAKKWMDDNKQ